MSEFEERSSRQLTVGEYLAILRRRIWWIIVPAVLGPIIGYGISLKLPSRYTSQTLVLVEEQKVPESFVKPVITDLLEQRLATMQEQILSRSRLQPIVERFGLYADQPRLSIDDKIELTRKATEIKPVRPDFGSPGIEGFYVSFTAQNARLAQQVCGELTSMFMEENLGSVSSARKERQIFWAVSLKMQSVASMNKMRSWPLSNGNTSVSCQAKIRAISICSTA